MILSDRQWHLLAFLIERYIRTAEPVASQIVAQESGLELSPATIRNEMMELERQGFLFQPHTSAGRVPTEHGYRYYAAQCAASPLTDEERELCVNAWGDESLENEMRMKSIARIIADLTGESVFVAFGPMNTYYTGLSNLFSKPEFRQQEFVHSLSHTIDHLDAVLQRMFPLLLKENPTLVVGAHNPFSPHCATYIMRGSEETGMALMGIFGPMRMNYRRNLGVINALLGLIHHL